MKQTPVLSSVYQLRVVLRGISPLIWRLLLVSSSTTIADLHGILQVALGWEDDHLHRFRAHGKDYGIAYAGGLCFADDPRAVRLADFRLHCGERFLYVYNFTANWEHDIRLEAVLPHNPRNVYPACTGGRRAVPPEECPGPWAYLEALDQRHFPFGAMKVMAKALKILWRADHQLSMREVLGEKRFHKFRAVAKRVRAYYRPEIFDRKAVNEQLATRAWERPPVEASWSSG